MGVLCLSLSLPVDPSRTPYQAIEADPSKQSKPKNNEIQVDDSKKPLKPRPKPSDLNAIKPFTLNTTLT